MFLFEAYSEILEILSVLRGRFFGAKHRRVLLIAWKVFRGV